MKDDAHDDAAIAASRRMEYAELVDRLRAVLLADGTPIYEHREMRRGDAQRPPAGARWLTPRELAASILRSLGETP